MSQEYTSSVFSQLTFRWLNPIIDAGKSKDLAWSDLCELLNEDTTEEVMRTYQKLPDDWSIKKKVAMLILPYTSFQHLFAVIYTCFSLVGPFYIFKLINVLQDPSVNRQDIWPLVVGFLLFSCIRSFLEPQMISAGSRAGTRMRALFLQLIYNKSLTRIVTSGGKNSSLGKAVTLMTVDTEMFRRFLQNAYIAFIQIPLSLMIATSALFYVLGTSAIVPITVVILLFPLTAFLGKRISKAQKKVLARSDARVSLVNELILGIRIIKYLAWEPFFENRISNARQKEIKSIIKVFMIQIGFSIVGEGSGVFISFITFAVYSLITGQRLDPATAFTSLSLFKIISDNLRRLPNQIKLYLNYRISMDRIISYLDEEDRQSVAQLPVGEEIAFQDALITYHGSDETELFGFKGLNASFPKNKLTLICGPTGAGKSTVLLALLGELRLKYGNIFFPSMACAYSSQSAWIMNATIKENILFGNEYDEARYLQVLQACALLPDLQAIPGGDLTEIGEKGINLSGGQKQRVALARACYSQCPIVILDDPISAVDAKTAQYLLHHVLLGFLKGRTVIITSHASHLIAPFSDKIICLNRGEIEFHGDYEEYKSIRSDLESEEDIAEPLLHDDGTYHAIERESRLITQEAKAVGSVNWNVYKYYFSKCGGFKFSLLFLSGFILQSLARVANDWWLKHWTDNHNTDQVRTSDPQASFFVIVYILLGICVILASSFQMISYMVGSWWASLALHHDLLLSILYAPMRFFETTPTGRILNRFAKDMESIDREVMDSIQDLFGQLIQGLTILMIIASANTLFLIAVPFIGIAYLYLSNLYLKSSRELKRFESLCRSPVYALFSETLSGVPTIRAYHSEKRFSDLMKSRIDDNHKARILWFSTNRWLSLRTEILSALVVFCAGIIIILSDVSPGWAALTITYSLDFTNALSKAVRAHADVELAMNSVERIQEYNEIPQEPPEGSSVSDDWPSRGHIKVQNLSLRYTEESLDVLKNVSFEVLPGEKLAICGKSGAGKSTLTLAFFRILQIPMDSVIIDEVDISSIQLAVLRSKLSIIPQEPVLFSGTIRSNIDPLGQACEADIWEAIKRVHFLETFANELVTLDMAVDEGGTNLSHGQRQLICLARAYIARKPIVFLDEATASVDHYTDHLIQQTIREEFKTNTVLCIAHRISTIIDYDKVLVLSDGEVVEFGKPYELMTRDSGAFKSLCEETGEFQSLLQKAYSHEYSKQDSHDGS
jgi:ABC-type multidrug transport system fused ATPase/permease subunit